MKVALSANIALRNSVFVRSYKPIMNLELMTHGTLVVHHFIVDPIVESQLLVLLFFFFQVLFHLLDAVMWLILWHLIDLDRQLTFLANNDLL